MPAWIYESGYFYKVDDGSALQAVGDLVQVSNTRGTVIAAFRASDQAFAIIADKQPTYIQAQGGRE